MRRLGPTPQIRSLSTAAWVSGSLGLALLGCRNDHLIPLEKNYLAGLKYVDIDARFCTSPRAVAKQKIKYLFILDHSQSNQPGFPDPLTPNDATDTDSNGARRYGPLVQFVNGIVPDPNNLTYFSLIDFNDQAAQPKGLTGFDADASHFVNQVVKPDWIGGGSSTDPLPYDHGFTNYQAALQLAFNLIKSDAQDESVNPDRPIVTNTYQVVFVSDGVPTIASTPGSANPTYTQDFLKDISPVISGILNLKNDPTLGPFISGISLSTAYYYKDTSIVAAETLLQQMAAAGNGQYLRFGTGESITYQAFAPPVRNIRYNLADIWVENQNVVAWDDGSLMLDSDADGMPDDIEARLGSNPFSADSDGNGVSDLIEYRTKGVTCNAAGCGAAGRDPYAICDGFSPSIAPDGSVTFPSSAHDGMNDCEKFVLGASRSNFDSNGDFIPDLLAFKCSLPFIAGTNGASVNPFGDELTNYQKLKQGYPLGISQARVLGFKPRVNSLTREESPNDDIDCYRFTSKKVAVLGAGNVLQLSVIENSSLIDDKPVLLNATQAWNGKDTILYFNPGDFK